MKLQHEMFYLVCKSYIVRKFGIVVYLFSFYFLFFSFLLLLSSVVPIIDYNRSLIENLKRRDNRLWKMFNRLLRKKNIVDK